MKTNKPTHTPGPWYAGAADKRPAGKQVSAGYHCGKCPAYWGVGNGKAAIARVLITGCVPSGEAIANARLIAAAPELLEDDKAVRDVLGRVLTVCRVFMAKKDYDLYREAINQWEQPFAIAEAEGE